MNPSKRPPKSGPWFDVPLSVRDYELDMFGVINNSVYLNYLEHARHAFFKARGIDLAELAQQGYNAVVTRVEVDYLASLRSADAFIVRVGLEELTRVRFVFRQEIRLNSSDQCTTRAWVKGTLINPDGKPRIPHELHQSFAEDVWQ